MLSNAQDSQRWEERLPLEGPAHHLLVSSSSELSVAGVAGELPITQPGLMEFGKAEIQSHLLYGNRWSKWWGIPVWFRYNWIPFSTFPVIFSVQLGLVPVVLLGPVSSHGGSVCPFALLSARIPSFHSGSLPRVKQWWPLSGAPCLNPSYRA